MLYCKPSFIALFVSGFILLVAIINLLNSNIVLEGYNYIIFLLVLSIAISLHGLLHSKAEIYNNYNPLKYKL